MKGSGATATQDDALFGGITSVLRRHNRIKGWQRGLASLGLIAFSNLGAELPASVTYYRYDGVGRLTQVCNANPGDGEWTRYSLDTADNRSSYVNQKTDIVLQPNSGISSPDGRFTLWMQPDSNLVLYVNSTNTSLWSTNTVGTGANVAYFQSDGNLVLYSSSGSVWSSQTSQYPCASLQVQNGGNVIIQSVDGQIVWQTGTGGH